MEVTALVVSGAVASVMMVVALKISVVGVVVGGAAVVVLVKMGSSPDPSSIVHFTAIEVKLVDLHVCNISIVLLGLHTIKNDLTCFNHNTYPPSHIIYIRNLTTE